MSRTSLGRVSLRNPGALTDDMAGPELALVGERRPRSQKTEGIDSLHRPDRLIR